jgi:hypothetical protein
MPDITAPSIGCLRGINSNNSGLRNSACSLWEFPLHSLPSTCHRRRSEELASRHHDHKLPSVHAPQRLILRTRLPEPRQCRAAISPSLFGGRDLAQPCCLSTPDTAYIQIAPDPEAVTLDRDGCAPTATLDIGKASAAVVSEELRLCPVSPTVAWQIAVDAE